MRKIIYLGIILSVLMLFACGKATVEDAAKDYVKKQCAFDNDFKIDTSKLKYTVTEKEGNRATVMVSGAINFDGQLFLVKSGNKWKISKKENVYGTQENAVPHIEQTTSHNQTAHK
jgi:hypothetical protein